MEHGLPSSLHEAELPPGRGFLSDSIQIQFAVGDPIADQPVDPAGLADRHPRLTRRSLPTQLDLSENTSPAPEPGSVVLGVADLADSDDMVAVDLTVGDLVVVGDPRSGRTTAACTVAAQLVSAGAEVWAIGGVRSALESLPALHRRAFGDDGRVLDLLENLARRPSPAGTSKSVYPGPVLVVDDLDLLDRPELERPFAAIAESGIRCVVAAGPFRVYSTNAFVQRMRRARSLLFLRPDGSREIHELTGVAPAIRPGIGMPPGRGILVVNRRATVIQVACLASGRTPG